MGNIIVGAVLVAVVCAIIFRLVKNKKTGKSSCGCGCSGCGSACNCHKD